MKLWIKSQCGEHLTEVKGIDYNMIGIIGSKTDKEKYQHRLYDDSGKMIGIYATKERCLEIIKEISQLLETSCLLLCENIDISGLDQDYLKPYKAINFSSNSEISNISINNTDILYEMPKE